ESHVRSILAELGATVHAVLGTPKAGDPAPAADDLVARCFACPGRGSNPHASRQPLLRRPCLPFHHPGPCANAFPLPGTRQGAHRLTGRVTVVRVTTPAATADQAEGPDPATETGHLTSENEEMSDDEGGTGDSGVAAPARWSPRAVDTTLCAILAL